MKKILSFALCFAFLVSALLVFPAPAGAASNSGVFGQNMTWSFDGAEGVLTLSGNGRIEDGDCIAWLFNINTSNVKRIEIESGITAVAPYCFEGYDNLTSVSLPDTLTEIPSSAFSGCTSLSEITIDEGNAVFGSEPNCLVEKESGALLFGVGNVDIGALNITSIENGAFSSNAGIVTLNIPESVTYIGETAFLGCRTISEINVAPGNPVYRSEGNCLIERDSGRVVLGCGASVIPEGVTAIGAHAFEGCDSLTEIALPESVLYIGESAFMECSSLESVTLSESITEIPECAFAYCCSLEEIEIPYGVVRIGDGAFAGCTSLGGVTVPDTVESIGHGAFFECASFTSIEFPDSVTFIGEAVLCGCEALETAKLPAGVTSIPASFFESCFSLTEIVFPTALETIGESAFVDCASLTSLALPDSVSEIGDNAFGFCTALETLDLPDSLETIGYGAFANCTSLETLILPESVMSIGASAFLDSEIIFTEYGGALYLGTEDDPYYALIETAGDFIGELEIHPDAKIICDYAFEVNDEITSVEIPSGVKAIGEGAFEGCRRIESIVIPSSVVSFGEGVFAGCSAIRNIKIPVRILPIANNLFAGCNSVEDVACEGTAEELEEVMSLLGDDNMFAGASVHIEDEPEFVLGDLDGDGAVNVRDFSLMKKVIAGAATLDPALFANADIDGDGHITAKDLGLMKNIIAGSYSN